MIPLVLVTGFLGSGKTTFLKHLAADASRRYVFLVNEFSAHDVDGAALADTGADTIPVPGGSIFCKCLVGDFIKHLERIPDRFGDFDALIVEASGIADPAVTATMLRETGLDQQYQLAAVVAIVDPETFPKLLCTLPNIRSQVASADLVLVNRCDLRSEEAIQQAEREVRGLNPEARIVRTVHAQGDFELPSLGIHSLEVDGEYAQCRDKTFDSFIVGAHRAIDPEALRRTVGQLKNSLFRIKGNAKLPDGTLRHFEGAGGELTIGEPDGNPERGLVVVCLGPARNLVQQHLLRCETELDVRRKT